jgi:hypothetical protein
MCFGRGKLASVSMGNVLSKQKREQLMALGRLGWSRAGGFVVQIFRLKISVENG